MDIPVDVEACSKSRWNMAEPRSVRWRVHLGVLSDSEMKRASECAIWRRMYQEEAKNHLCDPRQRENQDATVNNPLSQNPNSNWNQFWKFSELQQEIRQDIVRLHPGNKFFECEPVRKALTNVLMTWSQINSDIGYRQGMHEVLGNMYFVLYGDATKESDEEGIDPGIVLERLGESTDLAVETSASATDVRYVEHDAFALFSAIMGSGPTNPKDTMKTNFPTLYVRRLRSYYEVPSNDKLRQNAVRYRSTDKIDVGPHAAPIIEACTRIMQTLKRLDSLLHDHLVKHQIEPQFFAIKWLRLLYGREMSTEELFTLWDVLFEAEHSSRKTGTNSRIPWDGCGFMVEGFAVAMMLSVRDKLLEANDNSTCLQLLMYFSAFQDMEDILTKSYAIAEAISSLQHREEALSQGFQGTDTISFQSAEEDFVMVRHPNEDQEVSPTNPKKETMEYSRHIEALAVHLEESSERLLLPEAHNLLSELIQKIECSLEKNGRYIVELQDLEILKKARDMLLKSREK